MTTPEYRPPKQRRSIRIPGFDYSSGRAYYVTLAIADREPFLGSVANFQMKLSDAGLEVAKSWMWLAEQYECVELEDWVIMPDHLHGIISIIDEGQRKLGEVICAFKNRSRRQLRAAGLFDPKSQLWQRNYYEHIIRNERDLMRVRQYIHDNAIQFAVDQHDRLEFLRMSNLVM